MKHIKQGPVDAYDAYVESCRARRIIPCDRLSYERDACTRQDDQAGHEHAGLVPGHLGTSTQIVDTLHSQQREGVVQGNDTSPRVGIPGEGARARALQEAIALLVDAKTRLFRSNDCRDEFLNGVAHGFATYASASTALALAPVPERAERSFSITSWAQRFGVPPFTDHLDDPRKRTAAISAALCELYVAVSNEYASIVLETWEADCDREDFSKLAAGDAEQRKDGHALG
jgi:hypothetical protein